MSTIVYGVNRGDYSSYQVCAIFSTRKLAKAWIDAKPESVCYMCDGVGSIMHKRVDKKTGEPVASKCGYCKGTGKLKDGGPYQIEAFELDPEVESIQ